jgi:hypothetical protein
MTDLRGTHDIIAPEDINIYRVLYLEEPVFIDLVPPYSHQVKDCRKKLERIQRIKGA